MEFRKYRPADVRAAVDAALGADASPRTATRAEKRTSRVRDPQQPSTRELNTRSHKFGRNTRGMGQRG